VQVYLFSQMESVYWIARRYDIPFLLVVLNNGGWNALANAGIY
jgi:thiamine pyrophosphate-dependent acetolactate synthase large subunit-like protein